MKKKSGSSDTSTTSASPAKAGVDATLEKMRRQTQTMRGNPVVDAYKDKISKKLGNREKLMNRSMDLGDTDETPTSKRNDSDDNDEEDSMPTEDDLDDEEVEMLEAVERAFKEKRKREASDASKALLNKSKKMVDDMEELAKQMEEEQKEKLEKMQQVKELTNSEEEEKVKAEVVEVKVNKTTSGIGGAWAKNETSKTETYRPANGGWGYFPRPKDISRAYGGGKKIGADVVSTYEDELRRQKAVEETRAKLQRYREKVGIEVPSEKEHAQEIEEALELGQRAMQRGVYGTAVSALEKVTKWCSTNSQVGSQVFLELAMAYEAVGRTSEAIQVYTALSTSRMDDVKFNAKKLLYGIEAMQFMRNEAKIEAFSRKKTTQTFIDTTGLGNIAQNFDKVYNTAYVDLDRKGGFYKKLSQSVVRSVREARLILLKATGSGEVERAKIVQALRSIDRNFSDALKEEIKRNKPKEKPVAVMNGVPIVRRDEEDNPSKPGLDTFNLGDMDQVLENISGEWKLQLMADSKGEGVNFFNKTISWQTFDTQDMSYEASGPSGFLTLSQSGSFDIDEVQRIITRKEVEKEGSAAFFTDVYSSKLSGATAAVNLQQQIISVDSELLVTKTVLPMSALSETVKGYFSVWRRSKKGTYSSS